MKNLNALLFTLGFFIISCSNSTDPDYNQFYDSLTGIDAKAAIVLGNDWKDLAPKIKTHVTSTEVIFEFPDGRTVKKNLPTDSFYVAIAPYINNTHECSQHYPSSCTGELFEKIIKIKAEDENGIIFYDSNIPTLKNGFFEIWLPRNKNVKLQIEYNSMKGEETIPTKSDSRTCITTIKLK
ncbi:CueP family metal-binding protein [Candidatus Kapaibacterium sp.]